MMTVTMDSVYELQYRDRTVIRDVQYVVQGGKFDMVGYWDRLLNN
jgi:hypothetical protein